MLVDPFAQIDLPKATHNASFQSSNVNFDIDFAALMTSVDIENSGYHTHEDILAYVMCFGTTGTLAFTVFEGNDGSNWTEITSDTTKWRSKQCHGNTNTYGRVFQYLGTKSRMRITIDPDSFGAAAPLTYGTIRTNKRNKTIV